MFSFLHFKASSLKRRFQFGWSLTTVTHPTTPGILCVIKYCCHRGGRHSRAGAGSSFTGEVCQASGEGSHPKGGDVSKGQACRVLPGAGREAWRRLIKLVGPQKNRMCIETGIAEAMPSDSICEGLIDMAQLSV